MTTARDPHDSTAELPTLQSADALETVPGYQLIRALGESTLVRAFECRAERSGEIVVVKVLTKDTSADRNAVQRILRESRVVAGLRSHPNICKVLDVGESPGGPYVAFEKLGAGLAGGADFRSRLMKSGRLPVSIALAAVRDAAKAVEAAAAVGVAHRDIKPSNLFLDDKTGSVKLTDFGFAAPLSRLGGPEGVYGTPAFTAPELIRGAPADVRTDIYALGATLFQLVTARPLFEGSTPDVLAAHQKKPVPSIATMVPDAGIAVVDILYRLLHKDPARRPQTAGEVVKLLDDAAARAARTSSRERMPAVGAPPGAPGAPGGPPSPSEPQWPTMASPGPAPAPKPVAGQRREAPVTNVGASPFDQASMEGEVPYTAQPTGVMGTLRQMSVTEIIQMLEIGKKSARIEVQAADPGQPGLPALKGVVFVNDGQLVHCSIGGSQNGGFGPPSETGEVAIVTLCQKKDGFFRIHYEKEQCERNITRPTTFVLLEAMRTIDETASLPKAPGPASTPPTAPPQQPAHSGAPTPPKPTAALPRTGSKTALPALAKPLSSVQQPEPEPKPAAKGPAAQLPVLDPFSPASHAHTAPDANAVQAVWPQTPPQHRAEPTQAGKPKPVSGIGGIGDGIQFDPSSSSKLPSVSSVDDVTLREPALPKRSPLDNAKEAAQKVRVALEPALAKVRTTAGPALSSARAAVQREVPKAWAKLNGALEPLRSKLAKLHPKLGDVAPLAFVGLALGLTALLVVGIAVVVHQPTPTMSYSSALTLTLQGRHKDVIHALGDVAHSVRTAEQNLALGDAYAAAGTPDRAMAYYLASFPLQTDALELGFLLGRIDASEPDDEIDMLVLWPDSSVEDELKERSLDARSFVRGNANAVLVERGALSKIDVEAVALLDLTPREGTCATRKAAMRLLEVAGRSKLALETVERVGNVDKCFAGMELGGVYKAIKKRL